MGRGLLLRLLPRPPPPFYFHSRFCRYFLAHALSYERPVQESHRGSPLWPCSCDGDNIKPIIPIMSKAACGCSRHYVGTERHEKALTIQRLVRGHASRQLLGRLSRNGDD